MKDKNELSIISKCAEYYAETPLLQAITAFIPSMRTLSTLLEIRAKEVAEQRAKTFFDELDKGNIELTEEVIQSEEFIHKFVITAKATTEAYQREKIRRFARLFRSSFLSDKVTGIDEYEEYLRIIDDMSDREYFLLCLLEKYEKSHPIDTNKKMDDDIKDPQEHTEADRSLQFWGDFLAEASKKLELHQTQVEGMLEAIRRTGCYKSFSFIAYTNMPHDCGKLTPTWFKIRELIHNNK